MEDKSKIEDLKESYLEDLIALIKGNTVIPIIGYELLNSSAPGNVAENPELDVNLSANPSKDLLTKLLESYDEEFCRFVIDKRKSRIFLLITDMTCLTLFTMSWTRDKERPFP